MQFSQAGHINGAHEIQRHGDQDGQQEDFLQFVDQLDQEERLYTIAGAEDIYDDVKEPTPPMKREIVAEYLYALDGFESYLELKEEQADKPYYIPEKDELLKYQDDFYSEETKEFLDLGAYLRNVLKLNISRYSSYLKNSRHSDLKKRQYEECLNRHKATLRLDKECFNDFVNGKRIPG